MSATVQTSKWKLTGPAQYFKTQEDIDKLWDGYRFRLSLSQTLIVTLEDEARWAIRNPFS